MPQDGINGENCSKSHPVEVKTRQGIKLNLAGIKISLQGTLDMILPLLTYVFLGQARNHFLN